MTDDQLRATQLRADVQHETGEPWWTNVLVADYREWEIATTPSVVIALLDEIERLRAAGEVICLAYAGETAARNAGIEIRGFPMLDAYQQLCRVLRLADEPKEGQG